MRSFLLATIFLFAGSTVAVAQESYKGDAAATYEWVRANAMLKPRLAVPSSAPGHV